MRLLRLALAAVSVAAGVAASPAAADTECPPNQLFNANLQPYVCLGYTWDRYGNEYYVVGTCLTSPCRLREVHLQTTVDNLYCRLPDAC